MKKNYAQILARYVAGVITHTADSVPAKVEVTDLLTSPDTCDLAVSIDIEGVSDVHDDISGRVILAAQRHEESSPLLLSLIQHFGFNESLLDTPDGPSNVLSECLNIIIGRTSEEWSGHGFYFTFSIPKNISVNALPQVIATGTAFCIMVYVDDIYLGEFFIYVD